MYFHIGTSDRLKVSEFRTSRNIKTYSPIQFILNNVSALVSKLTRNSLHFELFSAICLIFFLKRLLVVLSIYILILKAFECAFFSVYIHKKRNKYVKQNVWEKVSFHESLLTYFNNFERSQFQQYCTWIGLGRIHKIRNKYVGETSFREGGFFRLNLLK